MQPQTALSANVPDNWRARMQGQKPAFYWAIAGVIGAVSIRLANPQSSERLVVPTLTLLGYAWVAYRHVNRAAEPALRSARLAQLADSLYFLGFLWTLWALIDSFVFRKMSGAEGIFTVFGYALVTTAVGMFLRLLLLQFRYGAEEQVGEAQVKVEERLHAFTVAISESLETLQQFRSGVGGASDALLQSAKLLQDRVARVEAQVAELEAIGERLQQSNAEQTRALVELLTKKFIETVAPPFEALAREASGFAEAVRKLTEHVATNRDDLCRTIDRHSGEIASSMEAGARSMSAAFTRTSDEVQKGATNIGARLDELARHIGDIHIPADISTSTEALGQKVRDLELALASITRNVRTGGDAVQFELAAFAGRIQPLKVPDDLVERVQTVNAALQQLERAMSNFENAVATRSQSLADGTASAERALNETVTRFRSIRVPETVKIDLGGVNSQVDELSAALQELRKALSKRAKDLNFDVIHVMRNDG